eukprot:TRINITY_DN22182_c0_g1_i1.p1 TRINITY_DN22182_c0_g1~~TRINITY_DN22182_c0_g1_i1.p1  ORF type:complete len:718 (+),score=82.28 TRINITY_DN22182_c0_g1_i1:73-2226(+)
MSGLGAVPLDFLTAVWQYSDTASRHQLRLTCRRFYCAAVVRSLRMALGPTATPRPSPSLRARWAKVHTVEVHIGSESTQKLEAILVACPPTVTTLRVKCQTADTSVLHTCAVAFPQLCKLAVDGCSAASVVVTVRRLVRLTELTLGPSLGSDLGAVLLATASRRPPLLALSACAQVLTDADLAMFAAASPNIQQLELTACASITPEGWVAALAHFNNTALRSLRVMKDGKGTGAPGFAGAALRALPPQLTDLALFGTSMSEADLVEWFSTASGTQNLQVLAVERVFGAPPVITDQVLALLAAKAPHLRELRLSQLYAVTDAGVAALAECGSLTALSLAWETESTPPLARLTDSLRIVATSCPNLSYVKISTPTPETEHIELLCQELRQHGSVVQWRPPEPPGAGQQADDMVIEFERMADPPLEYSANRMKFWKGCETIALLLVVTLGFLSSLSLGRSDRWFITVFTTLTLGSITFLVACARTLCSSREPELLVLRASALSIFAVCVPMALLANKVVVAQELVNGEISEGYGDLCRIKNTTEDAAPPQVHFLHWPANQHYVQWSRMATSSDRQGSHVHVYTAAPIATKGGLEDDCSCGFAICYTRLNFPLTGYLPTSADAVQTCAWDLRPSNLSRVQLNRSFYRPFPGSIAAYATAVAKTGALCEGSQPLLLQWFSYETPDDFEYRLRGLQHGFRALCGVSGVFWGVFLLDILWIAWR